MFFSQNVGSAIVMLITTLLFTAVTALMALVLIKVSEHIMLKAHTRFKFLYIIPHGGLKTALNAHYEFFFPPFPLLWQVHRLYRGGGGSLERAQEEWSTGLWKSAPVREAGFNAVAQTAQGPTLPQYPAAVPNYPDNSQW